MEDVEVSRKRTRSKSPKSKRKKPIDLPATHTRVRSARGLSIWRPTRQASNFKPFWCPRALKASQMAWAQTSADAVRTNIGDSRTWFSTEVKKDDSQTARPAWRALVKGVKDELAVAEKKKQDKKQEKQAKKKKPKDEPKPKRQKVSERKALKEKEVMAGSDEAAKKKIKANIKQRESRKRKREEEPVEKKQAPGPEWKFTRARKIRIFPTEEQKGLLGTAFDACRFVYNKIVEATKEQNRKLSMGEMRDIAVIGDAWNDFPESNRWKDIDFEIRDGAMRDVAKAVKSTFASMSARDLDGKHWEFKFRTEKDATESFALRSRQLNGSELHWYKVMFGRSGARNREDGEPIMKSAHPLPDKFESDVRIWHHRVLGIYMLIIPEEAPEIHHGPRAPVVSIDPGVRTFATCYDPEGLVCKWGCKGENGEPSANAKLWRVANVASSLRANMVDPNLRTYISGRGKRHRRRRHMRKLAARIEHRLHNLVDELHHKLALWLCTNYETILLPKFNTSEMAKKKDSRGRRRKIGKKTTRQMYSLAHCRFREYLKYLARRHGTLVCECDEDYTTKTCGSCGSLNDVGSSEVYRCRTCGARFDRDENAARNVLLKFIADKHVDL